MPGLIELVFEGLDATDASRFVESVTGSLPHLQTRATGDNLLFETELPSLAVGRCVVLKHAFVRLLGCNDGSFDVELNFKMRDAAAPSRGVLQQQLHVFAAECARTFSPRLFYAGLEPAVDEETRLFTMDKLGPLRL